jgi:hypothetical protein
VLENRFEVVQDSEDVVSAARGADHRLDGVGGALAVDEQEPLARLEIIAVNRIPCIPVATLG